MQTPVPQAPLPPDLSRVIVDTGLLDEVALLRERVGDLEGQVARMQELEERVDFTERLLAQREDALRLPREGAN